MYFYNKNRFYKINALQKIFKEVRTIKCMKKKKGPKNRQIKAVIFDIGGVLQLGQQQRKKQGQTHASGIHEKISKKLNISIDQYFDSIDTAYAASISGQIPEKTLLKTLSFNLKISEKKLKKIYINAYKKEFKINKSLIKQVKNLKKLGYKVAILSDQWHLSKPAHVPKAWYKLFDELIISCDVGIRKPDQKIYKITVKKLKVKFVDAIFIDNQIWNTKPAKKLGMKTILYKNNKQLFEEKSWKSLFKQAV